MNPARSLHPAGGLWFEPRGASTGIGSLPHDDPHDAVGFVARHCPQIPFCPQPPVGDVAAGIGDQLRFFESDHRRWFEVFREAAIGERFADAIAFKAQVTGPATLAALAGLGGGPVERAVRVALVDHVREVALWQIRRLRVLGRPVLVYVDEPVLGVLAGPHRARALSELASVVASIAASGGIAGVHCCTTADVSALAGTGVRVLSFDARLRPLGREASLPVEPTVVSFGVVAPRPPEPRDESIDRVDAFTRWLGHAGTVDGAGHLARRSIITPTCGLGAVDVATAEDVFDRAGEVSARVAMVARTGAGAARRG